MRSVLPSTFAVLSLANPALAQDNRVATGAEPDWVRPSELLQVPADASGIVFVRRQDFVVRLDGKGTSQHTGFRLKILHPNALQLGNLSIAWNPVSGSPVVHAIKVYRGNESFDVLKSATFEVLRRENGLEEAMLNGQLTAVLRVPDLRVGDELEFSVTVPTGDPTLGKMDAGVLLLLPEPQPGRFRLGLVWADGRKPTVKVPISMRTSEQTSASSIDFHFDNPGSANAPKDAPMRFQLNRIVEFSEFPSWADVSRKFAPLYTKAVMLPANSTLKAEAKRIASEQPGAMGRLEAALKLVQQDVRYIYVGLDGGNLTPVSAEETWRRRYGDCKGKTVLLMALLSELGIPSDAVLVNTQGSDDGLDEHLPNPGSFDHVIVRALVEGKYHWLDGTLPAVAGPSTEPVLFHRWVLPLTIAGSSLVGLPWRPALRPDEVHLYEIDARAGFDQPATITSTTMIRGIEGLSNYLQLGLT